MRARSLVLVAVLAAVMLLGSGCSKVIDALKPAAQVNHIVVKAKVGSASSKIMGTMKPGAPSNLPLWDGAGIVRNKVTKSDAGDSYVLTLDTGDTYGNVVAGMAAGFQNEGWQVEQADVSSGDSSTTVLTVASSGAQGVVTIVAQKDQSTHIDYVITTSRQ